jgi:hypothetical protein
MTTKWTDDVIAILKKIRINSYLMSVKHKNRYIEFKEYSRYFDLPVIVLSIFSSTFISFQSVPEYDKIMVNTAISMFIAILTSIKLYLNLSDSINQSESLSQKFYLLSINIYKILELDEENRKCDGHVFLNETYSEYVKLLDSSNIFKTEIKKDMLIEDIKPLLKPCKPTKNNQTQTQLTPSSSVNSINNSTSLTIMNEPDMIPEFGSYCPSSTV